MNFDFNTLLNVIIKPSKGWDQIKSDNLNNKTIFYRFLLPFTLLIFGACLVGYSKNFVNAPFIFIIFSSIITSLTSMIGIYLTSYVITLISHHFLSIKDFNLSLILIAFSSLPSLILSVFTGFFPEYKDISFIGFYSIYIMWFGLGIILETPPEKKINFLILSTIVMILSYLVVAIILTIIFNPFIGVLLSNN